MRIFLILAWLSLGFGVLNAQNKAETGTYQVEVPTVKHARAVHLTESQLLEIESLRRDTDDHTATLKDGTKVFVISRKSAQDGRRVLPWKIVPKKD